MNGKVGLSFLVLVLMLGSPWYLLLEEVGVRGYLSLLLALSLVIIGFNIFIENRHPIQTITWIIAFGAFPVIGFIFYLLFGGNFRKERKFRRKYFLDKHEFLKRGTEVDTWEKRGVKLRHRRLFSLAEKLGNSSISFASKTRILTNGKETYASILKQLRKAKHHIHLEYYIVRDDDSGCTLKDILIQKAKEGVRVRFLYDAVGCWSLARPYIDEMRDSGVEIVPFGPIHLPFINSTFNFRNHRKMIIVDGTIGFIGGLNIGDEYLGLNANYGSWRDTHLLVEGEAVRTLQLIFSQDWYYSTNQSYLSDAYIGTSQPVLQDLGGVQMIAGGPDCEWTVIKNLFFSMINSAEKSIWIASPYFVPDEDIFQALKVAGLSGLDVRILVPRNPDKWIVFHASRTYFSELLEAGVRIFQYNEGFMHSKIVIVDNELASIGSANIDMRSFHLNFEVNAFLYHTESTQTLVDDYLKDLKVSQEIQLKVFSNRNFGLKVLESTCRLLSPLL